MTNLINPLHSKDEDICDYAASHPEDEKQHAVGYAKFLRHIS